VGRIRTIKPEFPHSESIGRISRDARLLFIELWTVADDSGRHRSSSRLLASLLFPYDDDAPSLIGSWLDELEREGCIARYVIDGNSYLGICNFLKHQKIDHPSPSRLPGFTETSRILASDTRRLAPDLVPSTVVPSTKDQKLSSDESDGLIPLSEMKRKDDPKIPVRRVFDYYREKIGKSAAYQLTEKRMKKGITCFKASPPMCLALRPSLPIQEIPDACEKLMLYAVDQLAASDFHMGREGKGPYNEWEDNLFRDIEQYQKWVEKLTMKAGA
jgi:hypothetical protein